MASSSSQGGMDSNKKGATMIDVLSSLLKAQTGQDVSDQNVAQLLINNMTTLVQQGKLSQQQIIQVHCLPLVCFLLYHTLRRLCSSKCTPTSTRLLQPLQTGQQQRPHPRPHPLPYPPRLVLRILLSESPPILFQIWPTPETQHTQSARHSTQQTQAPCSGLRHGLH